MDQVVSSKCYENSNSDSIIESIIECWLCYTRILACEIWMNAPVKGISDKEFGLLEVFDMKWHLLPLHSKYSISFKNSEFHVIWKGTFGLMNSHNFTISNARVRLGIWSLLWGAALEFSEFSRTRFLMVLPNKHVRSC